MDPQPYQDTLNYVLLYNQLGLADILRSKQRDGAEEAEYLDVILRNAKRLQGFTEDILDVTRIESKLLDRD